MSNKSKISKPELIFQSVILTHFWSVFPFCNPENTRKVLGNGKLEQGTLPRNGLI